MKIDKAKEINKSQPWKAYSTTGFIDQQLGFISLDNKRNNEKEDMVGGISYKMEWRTKSRAIRSQQFWVYCESRLDNFAKFTLEVPGLVITCKSIIMKDCNNNLVIVEDKTQSIVKIYPLFSSSPSPAYVNVENLQHVNWGDFFVQIQLVPDDHYPIHPNQQNTDDVVIKMEYHNIDDLLQYPLGFTIKVNFKGRAEGWFRIVATLMYDNMLLTQSFSEPFMFNNPRMKKMKDHKFYSPTELKYMQIFALTEDKRKFIEEYGNLYSNSRILLERAGALFPL